MQVVGIMPCLLTAWGVAHGHRVLAFWRFLDGSQSTITACTACRQEHRISRLFTAFPNPFRPRNGGRSSGSSSDVPDFLTVLDLHLAEAEAESQVHLISPELPLPGLASVML